MLLCAFKAPPKGLSPTDYRKNIQEQILVCGKGKALTGRSRYIVFYSGPSGVVYDSLGFISHSNNDRSAILARALNAYRINDTEAGKFLNAQNLSEYFDEYAKNLHRYPDQQRKEKNKAYATVWGGPSELLAQMDFKKAATVVCGADHNRVFLIDEMEHLLRNTSCEAINEITSAAPRTLLTEVCKDAAFDYLCRSELKLVQTIANADIVNFSWWSKDLEDRKAFYAEERKDTDPPRLTPDQEAKKQAIIKDFKLEALYATEPQTWDCKLPSGAKVPAVAPILGLV